ncbi:MAG: ferredoxin [delta proteobacterium ML8_F1]|nr:MAG: ferredoxin [delta proteobacterium ML8_F1]
MKTFEELIALKEEIIAGEAPDEIKIMVGMATCGISAGAKPVMQALKDCVEEKGLSKVKVKQTGCIGVCRLEPMFEIFEPGGRRTTYVDMTPEKAVEVVEEHLIKHHIIERYTIGAYD